MIRSLLCAAFLVCGCGGLIHRVESDPSPPVRFEDAWSQGVGTSTRAYDGRWWQSFDSAELDALMEEAFVGSPTLFQAFARLDQASAGKRSAFSGFFPSGTVGADVARSENVLQFGGPPVVFSQTAYTLQAGLSYEVDVWGRVAHAHKAAKRRFVAAESDVHAAAISLAANVADTYFRVARGRAQLELLEAQLDVGRRYLELVQYRFDQGLASGLAVFQQRQQLASTRNLLPPAERQLAADEHQLAVLLGRAPNAALGLDAALPSLPPAPETGIPSAVLLQRPDVFAAQQRLIAQDHAWGSAIASRFPAVNLSANIGTRAFDDIANLFRDTFNSIGAGLTGTVFDGGRLGAEVRRNRALYEELLGAYVQTVLVALREVEDALISERTSRALVASVADELQAAERTLEEANLRYRNGLADYLPVLDALRQKQDAERRLFETRRSVLSSRVRLHRALGGTWAQGMERPRFAERED